MGLTLAGGLNSADDIGTNSKMLSLSQQIAPKSWSNSIMYGKLALSLGNIGYGTYNLQQIPIENIPTWGMGNGSSGVSMGLTIYLNFKKQ